MSTATRARRVHFRDGTPTDQAREFIRCASDPVYFIDQYVQIQHKVHGAIPFTLWDWQASLLDTFQRERRVILLKARQIGVSEITISYALWLIRFHPTKTVLVLSKNGDDADEMIQRATFAHSHLPDWLQAGPSSIDGVALGKVNQSTLEIVHHDANGRENPSTLQSLAATEKAGRSRSASLLILDEWAHQQADVWQGAEGATATGGQVIGISTANGVGNRFHLVWTKATRKENTFRPIFLPWSKHPDRDAAWYAEQARNLEEWLLHQEYPQQPEEAFAKSGRPVFSPEVIQRHAERVREADHPFLQQEPGITLWEEPIPGAHYLIGADVSEGKGNGDYQAAVVVDVERWVEVAELHERWPMEDYAAKLDKIGRYFNNAELAVEKNNHGHTILLALRSGLAHRMWSGEEEPYPVLYYYCDPVKPGSSELGWVTNSKTKPLMIDKLGLALREDTYQTRSLLFLDEAGIFSYRDNGTMGAPDGYYDDMVISRAIVAYILSISARKKPSEHMRDLKRRANLHAQRTAKPTQDQPITRQMLLPEKKKAWWE